MNLSNLESSNPRIKYACAKEIIKTARENPKELIKNNELFIKLLKSENNIMKWMALDAIGGITSVNGSEKGIKTLIAHLNKGKMITAGHAMDALAQVAKAKPEFRNKIINELLKIPGYKYDTSECNRIACNRAIAILDALGAKGRKVEEFLKKQARSERPATRKRARRLLDHLTHAMQ